MYDCHGNALELSKREDDPVAMVAPCTNSPHMHQILKNFCPWRLSNGPL